jgi:hypothetical protein
MSITSPSSTVRALVASEELPDRSGHVCSRKGGSEQPTEQRLEAVRVRAVDHGNAEADLPRTFATSRPAKPEAPDKTPSCSGVASARRVARASRNARPRRSLLGSFRAPGAPFAGGSAATAGAALRCARPCSRRRAAGLEIAGTPRTRLRCGVLIRGSFRRLGPDFASRPVPVLGVLTFPTPFAFPDFVGALPDSFVSSGCHDHLLYWRNHSHETLVPARHGQNGALARVVSLWQMRLHALGVVSSTIAEGGRRMSAGGPGAEACKKSSASLRTSYPLPQFLARERPLRGSPARTERRCAGRLRRPAVVVPAPEGSLPPNASARSPSHLQGARPPRQGILPGRRTKMGRRCFVPCFRLACRPVQHRNPPHGNRRRARLHRGETGPPRGRLNAPHGVDEERLRPATLPR